MNEDFDINQYRFSDDLYGGEGMSPGAMGFVPGPMSEAPFFAGGLPTDAQFAAAPAAAPAAVPAWQPVSQALTQQWQRFGIDPTMAGINRADELAQILTNYGITDLSRLGLKDKSYMQTHTYGGGGGEGDGGQPVEHQIEALGKQLTYGDKAFGYLGGFGSKGQEEFGQEDLLRENNDLVGWSAAGKGNVSYRAVQGSDGQVYIVPQWGSSSDWKDFRDMVRTGAAFASAFLPGAGAALGGSLGLTGTAAQAVGNAILGGVASGDVQGAVLGGLGGVLAGSQAVTGAASQIGQAVTDMTGSAAVGSAAAKAVTNMAAGLPQAAASGDFGSLLKSGLASVVPAGLSEVTGLSPQQIQGGIAVARGIESGNLSQILSGAGTFLDSPDVRLAGAAARVIEAADSGNVAAILSSVQGLNNAFNQVQNARAIEQAYGEQGQASRVAEGQDVVDRATEYLGGLPLSTPAGGTTADVAAAIRPVSTAASGAASVPAQAATQAAGALPAAGTQAATTQAAATQAAQPAGLPAFNNAAIRTLEQSRAAEIIAEMYPGQSLNWVNQNVLNAAASHIRNEDEAGLRERLRSGAVLGMGDVQRAPSDTLAQAGYRTADPEEIGTTVGFGPRGEAVRLTQQVPITGRRMTEEERNAYDIAAATEGTQDILDPYTGLPYEVSLGALDNPLVQTVRGVTSSLAGGLGEQASNLGTIYGVLSGDPDSALSRWGADTQSWARSITPENIRQGQANIIESINSAQGLDKFRAGVVAAAENPLAFAHMLGKEAIQEVLPMGAAITAGRTVSAATKAAFGQELAGRLGLGVAIGSNATLDAGESAASSYQQVYDELRLRGASVEAAQAAASRAAGMSGALTLFTSALGDSPLISRMMGQVKDVALKSSLRDLPTEFVQGYGQSVAEQQAIRGDMLFDPNLAGTAGSLESLIGATTTGGIAKGADIVDRMSAPPMRYSEADFDSMRSGLPSATQAPAEGPAQYLVSSSPDMGFADLVEPSLSATGPVGGLPSDFDISAANDSLPPGAGADISVADFVSDLPVGLTGPDISARDSVFQGFDLESPAASVVGGAPAQEVAQTALPSERVTEQAPSGGLPAADAIQAAERPSEQVVASVPTGGLPAETVEARPAQQVTSTNPVTGTSTSVETSPETGTQTVSTEDPKSGLSVLESADPVSGSVAEVVEDRVTGETSASKVDSSTGRTVEVESRPTAETTAAAPTAEAPRSLDDVAVQAVGGVEGMGGLTGGLEGGLEGETAAAPEAVIPVASEAPVAGGLPVAQQAQADVTQQIRDIVSESEAQQQAATQQAIADAGAQTTQQIERQGESLTRAISDVNTQVNSRIDALVQQGVDQNTATQRALADVNTNLTQQQTAIADTNARIAQLVAQGQTEQQATTRALAELGTRIGDQGAALNARIDELVQSGTDFRTATQAALSEMSAATQTALSAIATTMQSGLASAQRGVQAIRQQAAARAAEEQNKPYWLQAGPTMIGSELAQDPMQLSELENIFQQISPDIMSILAAQKQMAAPFARPETITSPLDTPRMASGGSTPSWSSAFDPLTKLQAVFAPQGAVTLSTSGQRRPPKKLAPLRQITEPTEPEGMARGGLPAQYKAAAPAGHNPEFITGLTGFYADGRGTGQSDDIPAMLHEGDYVMDADTVAALGDGSSKAGRQVLDKFRTQVPHRMAAGGKAVPAQIADGEYVFPASFVTALGGGDNKRGSQMLDRMREQLRMHKRSAPVSKIPPKAKSPLDYLKGKG